ncbi:MAG: hypothetical protein ACYC1E_11260 [Propionibacteriaceae bacterium]
MAGVVILKESISRIDLLLGQATMLTAVRWDEIAGLIQEAMGIVLLMAATRPSSQPLEIPGLATMSLRECVDQALREVQSWDLTLAADLPDLARLQVLLSDIRRDLDVVSTRRG